MCRDPAPLTPIRARVFAYTYMLGTERAPTPKRPMDRKQVIQKNKNPQNVDEETQVLFSLARESFRAYSYLAHNPGVDFTKEERKWKLTRFHSWLCDYVQEWLETDTGNPYDILLLSVPPQHGKSLCLTETLPSWYLGKYSEHRFKLYAFKLGTLLLNDKVITLQILFACLGFGLSSLHRKDFGCQDLPMCLRTVQNPLYLGALLM